MNFVRTTDGELLVSLYLTWMTQTRQHVLNLQCHNTQIWTTDCHQSCAGLAICHSVCLSLVSLFENSRANLTRTPYPGPTEPIGQNRPLLSPSTPFRLALTKFSDFEYMTGSSTCASNRLYENIEKSAISTPKSDHRVTVRPNFFLAHLGIVSWEYKLEANKV